MLLRNLLVDYNTEEPMIFGHRFKYFGVSPQDKSHTLSCQTIPFSFLAKIKLRRFDLFQGYMAGGSGYVLSKAALNTFVAGFIVANIVTYKSAEVKNPKACLDPGFEWGGEDVRMGEILSLWFLCSWC